ncbi:MAG: nuclear transport factor 2 family protein [Cyanobacteria bacterium P01_F01_bin.150]
MQSVMSKGRADVVPAPLPSQTSEPIPQDSSTPDPLIPSIRTQEESPLSGPSSQDSAVEVNPVPEALTMMLQQIDQAASNENLDGVMRFYSRNLQHSDGISTRELKAMLTEFWSTYENLNYSTEVTDWQTTDTGFVTTTVTTVTGQTDYGSRPLSFEAMVESRQVILDLQIVEQEVLEESSQISLGQSPPTVEVNLPGTVRPGETFYFDAIVIEPIGRSLLMGTAFSDPVSLDTYRTVPSLDVGILEAGGLFKEGSAPSKPGQEWVSGLVFREDGVTGVTQRLRIIND